MRHERTLRAVSFLALACIPDVMHAQSISIGEAFDLAGSGLSVRVVREQSDCSTPGDRWECESNAALLQFPFGEIDAAGNLYHTVNPLGGGAGSDLGNGYTGYYLNRTDINGVGARIGRLFTMICQPFNGGCSTVSKRFTYLRELSDVTNGRILLALTGFDDHTSNTAVGLVEITGLTKMFDVFQTFTPTASLRVTSPQHPDGFRSVEAFEMWVGNVSDLPDWSTASSFACAISLRPGEMTDLSNLGPPPAVGQSRYYIVASRSGNERRLGRQYVGGAYSARDPALLPTCVN